MRRLAAMLALCALLLTPTAALGAAASLPDIEDEVMCVTCNVPLNIAESPQADRQRALIQGEIDKGAGKEEILDTLVAEYGEDVLGTPEEDGFGITAYLIPALLIAGLIAAVAFFVPRWRNTGGGAGPDDDPGSSISPADSRRLDEDLARYEG